jgi:hypothetical protein
LDTSVASEDIRYIIGPVQSTQEYPEDGKSRGRGGRSARSYGRTKTEHQKSKMDYWFGTMGEAHPVATFIAVKNTEGYGDLERSIWKMEYMTLEEPYKDDCISCERLYNELIKFHLQNADKARGWKGKCQWVVSMVQEYCVVLLGASNRGTPSPSTN